MLKENPHCWWSSEPLHKLYYEATQNFTDFTGSIYWVQITEHNHGVPNCFSVPMLELTESKPKKLELSELQRLPRQTESLSWAKPLSVIAFFIALKNLLKCEVWDTVKPLELSDLWVFCAKGCPARGWKTLGTGCEVLHESLWAHASSQGDWWLGKMLLKQLKKFSRPTAEVLEEASLV